MSNKGLRIGIDNRTERTGKGVSYGGGDNRTDGGRSGGLM